MVKIKFNGGNGALLCEWCSVIIATGRNIPSQYMWGDSDSKHVFCCDECRDKWLEKRKEQCIVIPKSY